MELNLLHYTFTGDVENDGKVIGGGRVEESEGVVVVMLLVKGGVVVMWVVKGGVVGVVVMRVVKGRKNRGWYRGGAGGRGRGRFKNSKSSILTLLFLYNIIMCPPSKHFYYQCLQYTEKNPFLPQTEMQKGEELPLFTQA